MKKIYNFKNKINTTEIELLAKEIKNGKIIIFPTSTVYGVGTNALNKNSVEKVYQIKNRTKEKPCIVLVNDYDMISKITYGLNELEKKIADKFWPGPLTILLKKKDVIPDVVTSSTDYVGIRIDENEVVNSLVELSGVPLIAPSANVSGKPSQKSIDPIIGDFENNVDYIIDIGKLNEGMESTIIKVEENKIEVLREGAITIKQLKDCISYNNYDALISANK